MKPTDKPFIIRETGRPIRVTSKMFPAPDGFQVWPAEAPPRRLFWFAVGFVVTTVLTQGWLALAFHMGWLTGRG